VGPGRVNVIGIVPVRVSAAPALSWLQPLPYPSQRLARHRVLPTYAMLPVARGATALAGKCPHTPSWVPLHSNLYTYTSARTDEALRAVAGVTSLTQLDSLRRRRRMRGRDGATTIRRTAQRRGARAYDCTRTGWQPR
jgi:hypothetical protein